MYYNFIVAKTIDGSVISFDSTRVESYDSDGSLITIVFKSGHKVIVHNENPNDPKNLDVCVLRELDAKCFLS